MRAKRWFSDISASLREPNQSRRQPDALLATGNSNAKQIQTTVDSSYGDIGQNPNLKSLYCQAISRTYRFRTRKNESISVQEIMLETRLSFHIPELYIKILIDQESKCIATLNSLTNLTDRLQLSKNKHVQIREDLLIKYNEAIKGIVERSRICSFKTSIQKVHKELEFAPTNLHLQRMRVKHADCMSVLSTDSRGPEYISRDASGVHDILTVGAAAAHCLKFKNGGLLTLLNVDKTKKDWLSTISKQDSGLIEIQDLPVSLPTMKKDISTHISTLETLLKAGKELHSAPNRTSVESVFNQLEDKVRQMMAVLDNKALCTALHILLNPSDASHSASSLIAATNGFISSGKIEWEQIKKSVVTKMLEVGEKCNRIVSAADVLVPINQDISLPSPQMFDEILSDLIDLEKKLTSLTNLALQGQAVNFMQSPQESSDTIYRRDVVFSQTLSSCICGVITNLLTSLQEGKITDDFCRRGMLIEFESLLSTYKNELGMLEDFIVGVHDLRKVSFSCECAPEQVGNNMDHLLPTLHGTRHKLSVKLRLDPSVFATLPDSLKSGTEFKVVPVIFNVGINEEQSLADKIGSNSLQDYTNTDSYKTLANYCQDARKLVRNPDMLDGYMRRLDDAIQSRKNKNVEILQLAAQVCKLVNGVRLTSCKSAKDRTAMSVTLEQAQVLLDYHELAPDIHQNVVTIMRSEGTRRENTRKNVGVQRYAFTNIQLMTFPKQYRPPDGTYGKAAK